MGGGNKQGITPIEPAKAPASFASAASIMAGRNPAAAAASNPTVLTSNLGVVGKKSIFT